MKAVVECDVCGALITDTGLAMISWEWGEGSPPPVLRASVHHKGARCDRDEDRPWHVLDAFLADPSRLLDLAERGGDGSIVRVMRLLGVRVSFAVRSTRRSPSRPASLRDSCDFGVRGRAPAARPALVGGCR